MPALLMLQKKINDCDGCILYAPVKNEIDYNIVSFPLPPKQLCVTLPTNKDSDPYKYAKDCVEFFLAKNPYILIPGKVFDSSGTRIGNGGGWYDRFLSKVPKWWLRIGVARQCQISEQPLHWNEWDEKMHWLLIKTENEWNAINCKNR